MNRRENPSRPTIESEGIEDAQESKAEKGFLGGIEKAPDDPVGSFLEQLDANPELAEVSPSTADLSYLSPEQKAESLWATFQDVKGLLSGRKGKNLTRAKTGLALLKELYNDSEVRGVYQDGNINHLRTIEGINGEREKYQALTQQAVQAEEAVDASARNMFSRRGEGTDEIDALIFESNKRRLAAVREEISYLISENPELGALAEYENLKEYSHQLKHERFIWSPSRRHLLEEMELAALSGKPVLLSGESGTGKTRLVEQAALTLTGRTNSQTAGKDVRFGDLIAKPKLSAGGTSFYEYKEIGEAATGKKSTLSERPDHDGLVVADDEFNLRPTSEQSEMLARIAAWTPGKKVRLPVTNEEVVIAPDFLYCAMVNLASERYERKKIPPEVLRKFAKVDVDYPEQSEQNPELYEMMIAALLDDNGRLRAAKSELSPNYEYREETESIEKNGQLVKRNVSIRELKNEIEQNGRTVPAGGFLWRFANVLDQLNNSFSRRETILKVKGEGQYLQDLVLDIGTTLGWLKEYNTLGRQQTLEEFMIGKLNAEFLSKEAYSAEDRQLVKEFMKHFGLDPDKKSTGDDKPQFEIMTPVDIGLLSPRLKYKKELSQEPVLAEGYFLTAEGERVEYDIKQFELKGEPVSPGQVAKGDDGKPYEFLGLSKEDGSPVWRLYKSKESFSRRQEQGGHATIEQAQDILGKDLVGPEAIKSAFGFEVGDILPLPSLEVIRGIKERGHQLLYFTDKTPTGEVITASYIKAKLNNKASDGNKLLYNDFYLTDAVLSQETLAPGWKEVSKDTIPDSTSKNYVQQTEVLIDYLKNVEFKNQPLPPEYDQAIKEFEANKDRLASSISGEKTWKQAAEELSKLKITELTRETLLEVIYRLTLTDKQTGEKLLASKYTWTRSRSSDGDLVHVGDFDSDGAGVHGWEPDGSSGVMGVSFSRSV